MIFSAPMVRALLEGRKTQTRRVLKPQPSEHVWSTLPGYQLRVTETCRMMDGRLGIRFAHSIPQNREWDWDDWTTCPYGAVGDRLWVRETWRPMYTDGAIYLADAGTHRLNAATEAEAKASWPGWKPSIHMPRRHSRINLEITGVRVERLQSISERDAEAEGVERAGGETPFASAYRDLWSYLHGSESWDKNPWVWAIDFKLLTSMEGSTC